MLKKWLIALVGIILIVSLYFIEMSKVKRSENNGMPTLDNLEINDVAKAWEPFYKVRATIIDGQSASFSIPKELKKQEGKTINISGAVNYSYDGCETVGDSIKMSYFFMVPSLGIAQSCVIRPDISMRYTIRVNLSKPLILERDDLIDMETSVSGIFKIDTSTPYDAAFFIEDATAIIKK